MPNSNNSPVTKADLETALQRLEHRLEEYIDGRPRDMPTEFCAPSDYNNSANVRFRLIALESQP